MRGVRLGIATEEEVKALILSGDLSQQKIAEKLGIDQSTVSLIGIRHGLRRVVRANTRDDVEDSVDRELSNKEKEEIAVGFHVEKQSSVALAIKFGVSRQQIIQVAGRRKKRLEERQAEMKARAEVEPPAPQPPKLESPKTVKIYNAVTLYRKLRSFAAVAREMQELVPTIRKWCEDVELDPLPLPIPPVQFSRKKVESDLPLLRPEKITAEEIAEREFQDRQAAAAREAEERAVREAKPDGTKCKGDNACPFPAMIGGMCRRHYRESKALFSTSPSTFAYTIAVGEKFGA